MAGAHPLLFLQGHPPLVTILARFFGKLLGQDLDPQTNVLVTVGAYEALFCCFQALVDDGDEVIELLFSLESKLVFSRFLKEASTPFLPF